MIPVRRVFIVVALWQVAPGCVQPNRDSVGSGAGGGAGSKPLAVVRDVQEQNAGCCICHQPFLTESFAVTHAKQGLACFDCHGPSLAHTTDENFATPPDVRFKPEAVDVFCRECHPRHDVTPAKVLKRWMKIKTAGERNLIDATSARCTACHGEHRIAHAAES